MAILKPSQLSPQNSVIDATQDNTFSWQTNGALQTKFYLLIYNNDSGALLYSSLLNTSPNNYHVVPASSFANGLNCKWYVRTYSSDTDYQDSNYVYFETNLTPVVEFTSPDFSLEIEDNILTYSNSGSYTGQFCTLSTDTVRYLSEYASSSVKMTSGVIGICNMYIGGGYDLTQFSNGQASTTSDEIYVAFYIYDLADLQSSGVRIQVGDGVNYYYYEWNKSILFAGWNYKSIAKSSFSSTGSPDWADLDFITVSFYAANIGDAINFQIFEMHGVGAGNYIMTTQSYNFQISYTQAQDIGIKAYKLILSDSDGVEITDTDWIYDFALEYEFEGFENGETYQIEAYVVSQNGQEGSTGAELFDINYQNFYALPEIQATEYNIDGYIKIDWSNIIYRIMTYSSTASYVTGKFGSALDIASSQYLDTGNLNITGDTGWTVTCWIKFVAGLDDYYINIDDSYYFGYDGTLQRFYYYDGTSYAYSSVDSLAWYTITFNFIGFTENYFIIKQNNAVVIYIDISGMNTPTSISNIRFLGRIIIDNLHAIGTTLTNAELELEDYRYLIEATQSYTFDGSTSVDSYDILKAISIANGNNILEYQGSGTSTGYLVLGDDEGTMIDSTSFNAGTAVTGSLILLDTNLALLAYWDNTSASGKVKLISTTTTITIEDTDEFTTSNISEANLTKLSDGNVLLVYRDDDNSKAYLMLIQYTASTVTLLDDFQYELNSGNDASALKVLGLSSSSAVLYYYDLNSLIIKSCIVSIAQEQISLGNLTLVLDVDNPTSYVYIYDSLINIDDENIMYCFSVSEELYVGISNINTGHMSNSYINNVYTLPFFLNNCDLVQISSTYYALIFPTTTYVLTCQILSLDSSYNVILEDTVEVKDTTAVWPIENFSSCYINNGVYTNLQYSTTITKSIIDTFQVSTTDTDKEAVWINYSTRFLANFENDLNGGSITESVSGFRLKRLAEDGSLYQTLGDFDTETLTYNDVKARNAIQYTYALYSIDALGNENLGNSLTAQLDFFGWILTDGTNIYKFDLGTDGIDSGNINNVRDTYIYNNFTQYPTVGFSANNYKTGSISTIPYSYNSTSYSYSFTKTLLDELRDFITNSDIKWLKNTKGEIFKVVTHDFSAQYFDNVPDQPYEIDFKWTEIGIGEAGVS